MIFHTTNICPCFMYPLYLPSVINRQSTIHIYIHGLDPSDSTINSRCPWPGPMASTRQHVIISCDQCLLRLLATHIPLLLGMPPGGLASAFHIVSWCEFYSNTWGIASPVWYFQTSLNYAGSRCRKLISFTDIFYSDYSKLVICLFKI